MPRHGRPPDLPDRSLAPAEGEPPPADEHLAELAAEIARKAAARAELRADRRAAHRRRAGQG